MKECCDTTVRHAFKGALSCYFTINIQKQAKTHISSILAKLQVCQRRQTVNFSTLNKIRIHIHCLPFAELYHKSLFTCIFFFVSFVDERRLHVNYMKAGPTTSYVNGQRFIQPALSNKGCMYECYSNLINAN